MSAETNVNGGNPNPNTKTDNEAVETPQEELSVEELKQQLAEEQKKTATHYDNFVRARADYENLKRRTEAERAKLNSEIREKVLVRILPVVDDFERALQNVPENLKGEAWLNGVNMIEKKLKTFLEQENVSEIPAEGQEFDPRVHDAVHRDEESTGDKDVVQAVYQKGYKLGDKVIRPAVVKVGRQ
ncbi:MAG: nucleotide exchange factor GrpE [Chloroflexi bacterium]|nr:nucleotide exchange factor GrpE [Chloroflexota bacterium]